jgi:hypothetical protein
MEGFIMPEMTEQKERRKFDPGTEVEICGKNGLTVERKAVDVMSDGREVNEVWISTQEKETRGNGDIVVATGVDFSEYMKNPVVGWNHGLGSIDFPIARSTSLEVVAGVGIAAKFEWPPWKWADPKLGIDDVDDIHRLWAGRFINAASVWIRILAADPQEGFEDSWWPPLIIHKCLLLEWALVYVPMNQGALRRSLKHVAAAKYLDRAFQRERFRVKRIDVNQRQVSDPPAVHNVVIPISPVASDVEIDWSELFAPLKRETNQFLEKMNHGR